MRFPYHDLSIVIPTYRESGNLTALFQRIESALATTDLNSEILVVDDNSNDGTEQLCREHPSSIPIELIVRQQERGLSSAVLRGFESARGEVLLVMDADLSHPPECIPAMVDTLLASSTECPRVDMVIGSRYVQGGSTTENWGWARWVNSKIATALARPFTSANDPMAGFFAMRRTAFEEASGRLDPIGYKIGLELIVKCHFDVVKEVPIRFTNRTVGESKLSLREQLNYLTHLKRLASYQMGRSGGGQQESDSTSDECPSVAGTIRPAELKITNEEVRRDFGSRAA
ncbi:Undecaprenyl-phosphate mannosyltransferase [Rubripirellula lacrimiformis]|uniref:Undecaprenyl-phosphate mannosyltransferase n=1 Tax=Rubripirellula lacrimiformis TaxID=1930273 RepID=A0A517N6B8_9BACT|nr:polyprenol monophosphomannose synthase [Rubripirellula lacrimiformis]QDT02684.1 Undecaprenyl-phosphate mannosyltransferase [Rubripirellula lacrimiformis]